MEGLMKRLAIPIPDFILQRRVGVSLLEDNKNGIAIRGVDLDGLPYSLFKSINVTNEANKKQTKLAKEPFNYVDKELDLGKGRLTLDLEF